MVRKAAAKQIKTEPVSKKDVDPVTGKSLNVMGTKKVDKVESGRAKE